jgi:hypothetical protein
MWREGFPRADLSGVLVVILSASAEALSAAKGKDLCVRRARPFAEFTLSEAHGLRMTGLSSKGPDPLALS